MKRRLPSSGNFVPTQRTIASKKREIGPASFFHFSPCALPARPSFHGFQFSRSSPGRRGAPDIGILLGALAHGADDGEALIGHQRVGAQAGDGEVGVGGFHRAGQRHPDKRRAP